MADRTPSRSPRPIAATNWTPDRVPGQRSARQAPPGSPAGAERARLFAL